MGKKVKQHPKFTGIFANLNRDKPKIYTINADKGRTIYGERTLDDDGQEFREWNPFRSKLAAAVHNNCRNTYVEKKTRILYLGASSGTTVSHVSDIVTQGLIYAGEISPRSLRELVQNMVDRSNVIPILGDANRPFEYSKFISDGVDIVYMDVAQPNQTEIMIKNAQWFLKPDGFIIYAIKARAIDTTAAPTAVFKEETADLEKAGFTITDRINLSPYSADHLMVFARYTPK